MDTKRCDSCGRDEPTEDVVPVYRVYVTPGSWDTEEHIDVQTDVEHWCFACRSHYPHQPLGATEPEL